MLLTLSTIPAPLEVALYRHVRESLLEAVVEVHTHAQLERALQLKPTIVGINNRDVLVLEKDTGDVRVTEQLAPLVGDRALILSESSLTTPADVQRAVAAGAHAVLVGTAILRAADPVAFLNLLVRGTRTTGPGQAEAW